MTTLNSFSLYNAEDIINVVYGTNSLWYTPWYEESNGTNSPVTTVNIAI